MIVNVKTICDCDLSEYDVDCTYDKENDNYSMNLYKISKYTYNAKDTVRAVRELIYRFYILSGGKKAVTMTMEQLGEICSTFWRYAGSDFKMSTGDFDNSWCSTICYNNNTVCFYFDTAERKKELKVKSFL
jgi:hypothetical protein